jgi:integrase
MGSPAIDLPFNWTQGEWVADTAAIVKALDAKTARLNVEQGQLEAELAELRRRRQRVELAEPARTPAMTQWIETGQQRSGTSVIDLCEPDREEETPGVIDLANPGLEVRDELARAHWRRLGESRRRPRLTTRSCESTWPRSFAGRSLDSITPDDLEAFVRAKATEGKSAKTIRNALGLLHSVYEYGQRKGWANANPCKRIDKPRDDGDADIRFLDFEELDAVIRAEAGDELAPTLAVMYRAAGMTGLRQGELIGLRWQDVDWPAGRVRVRRSYVRGEFSSPTSRRGSRSVPLADELAGELERHYQASAWQADADLVFAHPRLGGPLDRAKVRKRFKLALKAAGVREVRFHDLRHTFGTRMAGAGVPMRTLQEWMGHRDFKTTLIYADYSPSVHEREWVEAAFARQASGEAPAARSAA